jgi:membrane peptidoglycan carboxypeptidase
MAVDQSMFERRPVAVTVLRWWQRLLSVRWLRRAFKTLVALMIALLALFSLLLSLTPSVSDAPSRVSARITEHPGTNALTAVPTRVAAAVVATEDHRFYEHPGIDALALGRVGVGLLHGNDGGGATIELQLAKLLYTDGRADWASQWDQVGIAIKLDQTYTKDQILLMYFNVAYFGHGFYGLQAASIGYFDQAPQNLDWPQAAMLAGLLQAPTDYDPIDHPQTALLRRHHVLDRLAATGVLTPAEASGYDGRSLELHSTG